MMSTDDCMVPRDVAVKFSQGRYECILFYAIYLLYLYVRDIARKKAYNRSNNNPTQQEMTAAQYWLLLYFCNRISATLLGHEST